MSWIDEPGAEERWEEWESMVGDVSLTIDSLEGQFGGNETSCVIALADTPAMKVAGTHEALGVLHLAVEPIVDIAKEVDLARRVADEAGLEKRNGASETTGMTRGVTSALRSRRSWKGQRDAAVWRRMRWFELPWSSKHPGVRC